MSAEHRPQRTYTAQPLGRPVGQLHDYPLEIRWEVTRRHPYYLSFWDYALAGPAGSAPATDIPLTRQFIAWHMLGLIGVQGMPYDPATSAEDMLGRDLDPLFLSGSIQPMTMRAMAALLIQMLPANERHFLGQMLLSSRDPAQAIPGDTDQQVQRMLAVQALAEFPSQAFDACPDAPFFQIHMGASLRTLQRDLEEQSRRWKAKLGIEPSKVHTAKLAEYLAVWDLREGWTGSGYDPGRQLPFAEIGQQLRISKRSTLAYRYRSAFAMITGHEFTPELWFALFAPLNFTSLLGDPQKCYAAPIHRRIMTPTRRPAPDTRVSRPSDQPHQYGVVELGSAFREDQDLIDLRCDFEDLSRRGFSDAEIAQKLELPDANLVAVIRERLTDLKAAQDESDDE